MAENKTDPFTYYAAAVERITAKYDAHGYCPWIFETPGWRESESAIESAFAARRLGVVRRAVDEFEVVATELLQQTCAIVRTECTTL